jgi:O-acetyl-ADP-ribose deacetylase (regulator of RNase III)
MAAAPAAVDIHANQADDALRTDHSAELRDRNAADLERLLSAGPRAPATDLLCVPHHGGAEIALTTESIAVVDTCGVVNAANETLEGGGGVDQAIHAVAGPKLRRACLQIPRVEVNVEGGALSAGDLARCPVGEARVTPAFDLPHAKFIVHTVAPLLDKDGRTRDELLRQCYVQCLNAAEENGMESLAFCALGTGFYGFPQVPACEIALGTTLAWLRAHSEGVVRRVVFCMYGTNARKIYPAMLGKLKADVEAEDGSGLGTPHPGESKS